MAKKPQISSSSNNPINFLHINEGKVGLVPEVKILIKDYEGKPIKNYSQLSRQRKDNKIKIFLDFFVASITTEIEEDELVVEYRLKNTDSEVAYLQNKKEALIKHLCEYLFTSSELFTIEKDKIKNDISDDLVCELIKETADNGDGTKRDEIVIKLRKKDDALNKGFEISMKNAELKPSFNLPSKLDEVITFFSPSKEPKFWTLGKIISACVVIGMIAALIFFYRKKIWSWIKREDETKKKEQVEIF